MSHHFPLSRRRVATPVDWRQGGAVIVAPSVKPEDAPALFPKGVKQHEVPSGKVRTVGKLFTHHIIYAIIQGYMRTTPMPE